MARTLVLPFHTLARQCQRSSGGLCPGRHSIPTMLRTPAPNVAANHERRASSEGLVVATVIPTSLAFSGFHSLRPKIVWITRREREYDPTDRLGNLLLGVTERGTLDLVQHAPMDVWFAFSILQERGQCCAIGWRTEMGRDQKPAPKQTLRPLAEATMSNPHLPAEMLDHIVDHLHDAEDALRNCCLVSKLWIPRTRKHLFATIRFITAKRLQSWKETFPDPSISPAHYVKTLSIRCPPVLTAADMGSWAQSFSRVVNLDVASHIDFNESAISCLVPFHGFSPTLKSLRITVPYPPHLCIFNLIFSFPFLEDLAIIVFYGSSDDNGDYPEVDEVLTTTQSPSPLMFTGSLELFTKGRMEPFTHRLLSRPGGIRFQKLVLTRIHEEDLLATMALVKGCSYTLESLDISCNLPSVSIWHMCPPRCSLLFLGECRPTPIDLSGATKLKDLVFHLNSWTVGWVVTTLQTITPKHRDFRQLRIDIPYCPTFLSAGANVKQTIGEANYAQWSDLDRLLIQLWESRAVRPQVACLMADDPGCLLPEGMKNGIVDFVS